MSIRVDWDSNVYYNPAACHLEEVDSLEMAGESYQFDLVAVWKTENGVLYWGMDEGCSCPTPFERVTSVQDLEWLQNNASSWKYFEDTVRGKSRVDPDKFLDTVKQALTGSFKILNYT